jgi:exopolysaccharide biosynthesis polyprenyl glycosylphosphotransferase
MAFVGDAIVILLGLLAAFWIRFHSGWIPWAWSESKGGLPSLAEYRGLFAIGSTFFLASLAYAQLYEVKYLLRPRRFAVYMLRTACFWLVIYIGTSLCVQFKPNISRGYAVVSFLTTSLGLATWRHLLAKALWWTGVAGAIRQRLIVVGRSGQAAQIVEAVQRDRRHPYDLVMPVGSPGFKAFDPPSEELVGLIQAGSADMVILADLSRDRKDILEIAHACERAHMEFKLMPDYFQVLISGLQLETLSGIPILGVTRLPLDRFLNRFIKRGMDILGALVGLVLSSPAILACAYLVKRESPGPVFFGQERVGRAGRRFKMYKIRSMRPDAASHDHLSQSTLREDPRVLKVGKIMRRWNLDELPQFWNVLTGDMSLVGPRPERSYHVGVLSSQIPHYNARHVAKPGITGWAQVNGLRGDTDLGERVRCDLWYLENWSVWLDFQIMAMTFLSRKNAY